MNELLKHAVLGAISAVALAVIWGVLGQATYTVITMF